MDREERRDADKLYNLRTSTVLNVNYAYNDWLSYFNSLLPKMSQLEESDDVIVGALSFFEKLGDLLNKTQKRVLSNYVIWRHVQSSVNYLPARFRSLQQEYVKLTSGREVADPRWLECVDLALNHYPHAFGALYARRHFNKEAKSKALEMVMNIKTEVSFIVT